MMEPIWIDQPQDLAAACDRWRQCPVIAVDTEFVRERTFYPALGLLQVSDGTSCWLVDPLRLDLKPLAEILLDDHVVKVLHSCGEDLEVLFNRFGELPWPLSDTQIAAAFAGYGPAISYRNLVAELCGADIPKDETRTNWLRRPLTDAQMRYAALDVAYLLPCHEKLIELLDEKGRSPWLEEELERLRDTSRFEIDPEEAYLRIKGARGLPRPQLAIARALAAWREREARRRNLPRNFVLPEAAVPQIARLAPRRVEALEKVRALRRDQRKKFGSALVGLVKEAMALPEREWPNAPRRPLDLTPHKSKVQAARDAVAAVADDLEVPPELIANRRTVEMIVRRAVSGAEDPLAPDLDGWRRPLVEESLLACL